MSAGIDEWEDFVTFCAKASTCQVEVAVVEPKVQTLADARKLRDQLERRVAALPEACRVIIGLHFCRGLGLDQIGKLIQLPQVELERLFAQALRVMNSSQIAFQEGMNHG